VTVNPARVVGVDWSGAATDEHRSLWLAEWDVGRARLTRLAPASRAGAQSRLLALAGDDPALVVGLDFCFSLPLWWLQACGVEEVGELWADGGRLEEWLLRCDPPFWGRPGRRRPPLTPEQQYRSAELACSPRPRSAWQIGGAGSVGTASLRGMPVLAHLRRAGFAIWPFDPWRLPAVVEAWPRLTIGRTVKSRPAERRQWRLQNPMAAGIDAEMAAVMDDSADAFDAVAAALGLAARAGVTRPDVTDPVVRLEGWIDGVPIEPGQ
jgi:hypothetical protein